MSEIAEVARYLQKHRLRLVTAESCTAGIIAARLVDYPEAGEILDCAFVTYSPAAKRSCLGVSEDVIDAYGLTSEQLSIEMAKGALARSHANVAIANTGVTEDMPDGPPAGTQCFSWIFGREGADSVRVYSQTRRFSGRRNEIRNAAADYALAKLMFLHAHREAAGSLHAP